MVGHHGTSKENARQILREGFIKSTGEQWFGDGVYFFEEDAVEAKNWAIKVRGFVRNYTVLKANINAQTILDLTKGANWEQFIEIRRKVAERKEKKFKHKIEGDGVAINLMCDQLFAHSGEIVDVVKAGLTVGYKWSHEISNIPRMQYQLCVRNLECILNIQVEVGFSI